MDWHNPDGVDGGPHDKPGVAPVGATPGCKTESRWDSGGANKVDAASVAGEIVTETEKT
jgi:hypothetical protein